MWLRVHVNVVRYPADYRPCSDQHDSFFSLLFFLTIFFVLFFLLTRNADSDICADSLTSTDKHVFKPNKASYRSRNLSVFLPVEAYET